VEADDASGSCASRSGSGVHLDSSLSGSRTSSCTWGEAEVAADDMHAAEAGADDIPEAAETGGGTAGAEAAEICNSCRAEPGPRWKRPSQKRRKVRAREQEIFSWPFLLSLETILKIIVRMWPL